MTKTRRRKFFGMALARLLFERGSRGRGFAETASELVFMAVIVALIVLTAWAAASNIQRKGWTSDAAAWAQAAGSIIAIAGAAWLARGEARQARRWRREQGEEGAWSARFILAQAQFDSQIIAAELLSRDGSFNLIRSWKQRAENAVLALQTLINRTDYVHPVVPMSAANAKVLMDYLALDLAELEANVIAGTPPSLELVGEIADVHRALQELLDHFDARMRGVRVALDEGRDMLPVRTFRGWSV